MKTKLLLFITFNLCSTNFLYSQVTIGNVERKEEQIALRPPPYDSLKNLRYQTNVADIMQYIGLQLYLPPTSNPSIGEYNGAGNFLFSTSPTKIKAEKTIWVRKQKPDGQWYNELILPSFDNIVTLVYKPIHYFSGNVNGSTNTGITSDSAEVSNKYFTILSIFYLHSRDSIITQLNAKLAKENPQNLLRLLSRKIQTTTNQDSIKLMQETIDKLKQQKTFADVKDKPFGSDMLHETDLIFLLKNNSTNDSVYCSDPLRFILVPYFVKQKQLYEGKNVVFVGINSQFQQGSKWKCSEVTLLKKSSGRYNISYILKNDNGTQVEIEEIAEAGFITEEAYIKREQKAKLKVEELAAKERQEEKVRLENEKKAHDEYKMECINKYGQHKGELISEGKVEIGMTTEMCKVAWGIPFNTYNTTTASGTNEHWFYNWKYNLFFENGSLVKIEN